VYSKVSTVLLVFLVAAISERVVSATSLRGSSACPYLARFNLPLKDQADIDTIVNLFHNSTIAQFQAGEPWIRHAHAKQHGCVRAYVSPVSNLGNLAQGIFASNETRPAFIRFSNGVGRGFTPFQSAHESDAIPDIRGMGLKILNLTGFTYVDPLANSQTYTFTTDRVAFLPDIPTALSFFKASASGKLALTAWLANPVHWRLAALFAGQGVYITDLLTVQWYSPVPTEHGNLIVKHHLIPATGDEIKNLPEIIPSNGLRQQLVSDLKLGSWVFKWQVQEFESDDTTPVNDPTVPWNTPWEDLAYITIPGQTTGSAQQETFCEWMGFGPQLSVEGHGPVGDTQAIRTAVYKAMMSLRHQLHNQADRDATIEDWNAWPSW